MITNAILWELFATSSQFNESELAKLKGWCDSQPEKPLSAILVEQNVFKKEAPKTLSLIQKGFIQGADLSMFFTDDGYVRLKTQLSSAPKIQPALPTTQHAPETHADFSLPATMVISNNEMSLEVADTTVTSASTPEEPDSSQTRTPEGRNPLSSIHRTAAATNEQVDSGNWRTIKPGMVLGRCVLIEMIGRGTFGMVFRALHQTLNITVAIKILHQRMVEQDPVTLERLKGEAQLLAQLNHPNIVRVLDFDDGAIPYIILEMVEGMSLADLIYQCGGLRTERALPLFLQVAEALEAALEFDIVHRDVKPANILVTKKGIAKLADLGLAVVNSEFEPQEYAKSTSIPIGTAAYICPEQVRGDDPIDFRSDIYSLGVTFYHALTGRMPFVGRSSREVMLMHVSQEPTPIRELAPSVPPRLEEIIANMMAKDPDDRYQSYGELIADLKQVGLPEPSSTPMYTAPTTTNTDVANSKKSSASPEATGFWANLLNGISKGGKK